MIISPRRSNSVNGFHSASPWKGSSRVNGTNTSRIFELFEASGAKFDKSHTSYTRTIKPV